jgi:hypothetical protein
MLKKLRIRTEIGVDKEVTFDLNQDFDLLEILSLNLHQTDVYPKDCSEFGVVCGRVLINGGFGLPNAKISIFIPLDETDEQNPQVKELYPYKTQNSRNEMGYRYNLLPTSPSYTGHLPSGSFPDVDDILLTPTVSYVYKKYYKYNAKTNDAGDFMIYGAPLGEQSLVMNVDLSDIGCFSMVPEDFKLQGFPESDFNGAQFKTGSNLDSLPQIIMMSKAVDVRPLWGDDESGCGASITRADFDLREAGAIEIKPTSVFMGSIASDNEKNSVNKQCKPRRAMGELCSLVPQAGTVESVRFTPFWKKQARPSGFTINPDLIEEVPVLERFDINGGFTIDDNGSFLLNVPMNLDYVITNEFGERELSPDPTVGIPTKGKYRFRIKPLETTGSARQRRRAGFLVPQIKEYYSTTSLTIPSPATGLPLLFNTKAVRKASYYFGVDYFSYAEESINMGEIISCKDVFYEFSYGRAYAVSQFINKWKARPKDAFIGIKEVAPREEDDCGGQAVKFPINSANKNVNFAIVMNQFITRFLQAIWTAVYFIMVMVCTLVDAIAVILGVILGFINGIMCFICVIVYGLPGGGTVGSYCNCSSCPCSNVSFAPPFSCSSLFGCLHLRVTKYPECEKCGCFSTGGGGGCTSACDGSCDDDPDGDPADYIDCSGPSIEDYALEDGCYNIQWDNILGAIKDLITGDPGPIASIADWRKRENLFRSMCDGLMNYFWSNNWITGFLYAFQFKAKVKPDNDEKSGFKIKMCNDLVVFHPDSQNFYYRCTPYYYDMTTNTGYFEGQAAYDAHSFNAWNLLNPVGILAVLRDVASVTPAAGANRSNILSPTTIMDLGPLIENIGEICVETGGSAEGCSVANDIGVTSFTDPGEFMFDSVNEIVNANSGLVNFINLQTPFKRKETGGWFAGDGRRRELNGGMASILSQFNEIGTVEYESAGDIGIYLFGADVTTSGPNTVPAGQIGTVNTSFAAGNAFWTADGFGWDYAPPGAETAYLGGPSTFWQSDTFNGSVHPQGSTEWINAFLPQGQQYWEDRSVSVKYPDSVQLTVGLTTATTTNQSGPEVRDCLNLFLSNSSQIVPFYSWDKGGPNYGAPDRYIEGDFMTGTGQITDGDFQDRSTWGFPTTPITSNQTPSIIGLGTGYHFYFGLKPGATSYDLFAKKYIPLQYDDEIYL